jgi:hypothetical protein
LKKGTQELCTTQSPSATSAHNEILKRLFAIVRGLFTPLAVFHKPSKYSNHACQALSCITHDKTVPSSAPNEVTVKIMGNPKPSYTSEKLVESIDAVRSSKASRMLRAQEK